MLFFYPRLQIVFWPTTWRLSFTKPMGAIACCYEWFLWVGPFDIRRWKAGQGAHRDE